MSGELKVRMIEFSEKGDSHIESIVNPVGVGDFNLFIGDNAQGKSRFFRTIHFLSTLFSGAPNLILTRFFAKFTFQLSSEEGEESKIEYQLEIEPKNPFPVYNEWIQKDGVTLFSKRERILFNESKQENIENFFLPENVSAILSISGSEFPTINTIRNYFQRIVFLTANKAHSIDINPNEFIPNIYGSNIATVLYNWKNKYNPLYNEVIHYFQECFSFIKEVKFNRTQLPNGQIANLLAFRESDIRIDINQVEWSDGIYRVLCFLLLPKIPFSHENKKLSPSLILIDEIENGLDYKTLKYVIHYLQSHSDDSQIFISSHSPLVCEFINPKDWLVAKRTGSTINFINPSEVEDIENQLELFKQEHWELYSRHISNSKLYTVK